MIVGARDLAKEALRVANTEIVRAERADADDVQIRIAQHDRVRRTPLVAGEQARRDEVDVGLERRLEAVANSVPAVQDWAVVGVQPEFAWTERVAVLPQVHELRRLRFADDELRAPLDGAVIVWKPV